MYYQKKERKVYNKKVTRKLTEFSFEVKDFEGKMDYAITTAAKERFFPVQFYGMDSLYYCPVCDSIHDRVSRGSKHMHTYHSKLFDDKEKFIKWGEVIMNHGQELYIIALIRAIQYKYDINTNCYEHSIEGIETQFSLPDLNAFPLKITESNGTTKELILNPGLIYNYYKPPSLDEIDAFKDCEELMTDEQLEKDTDDYFKFINSVKYCSDLIALKGCSTDTAKEMYGRIKQSFEDLSLNITDQKKFMAFLFSYCYALGGVSSSEMNLFACLINVLNYVIKGSVEEEVIDLKCNDNLDLFLSLPIKYSSFYNRVKTFDS